MKTKRFAMAVGLVAAMTVTAATVFAWGPGGGRGYGAGYGPGYAAAALAVPALTPEQSAKIQKFQAERYAERAKFQGEMAAKRVELQQLYRAPELDKAKIAAKQKELSELQARNREKAAVSRLAFLETLTPEQRAQMPANGAGYGGGRGRGMGFGGRW
jgi:Spy/CpxP family protein refolding chaperone